MVEHVESAQICPYLGLGQDRDSRFSYPETGHLCFAAGQPDSIPLDHQAVFCLSRQHLSCSRFVEPPPDRLPGAVQAAAVEVKKASPWRVALLGLGGALVGLAVIFGLFFFNRAALQPDRGAAAPATAATATPFATLTPPPPADTPTPSPPAPAAAPTATITPVGGGELYALSPTATDIGWVVSSEDRGNHFGDSYIYTGILNGQVYHGAFQFDLSLLPRGAPIYHASLQLTGLRDDLLRTDSASGSEGVWTLRFLAPEAGPEWRRFNYQDVFNSPTLQTLAPILGPQDLAAGQTNTFELSPAQINILETRIIDDEAPTVSFRLDGPLVGPDNLFAWDSGYGPQSQGNKVTLLLSVGEPPATPPPLNYIVVTSTPTPENVVTAAAIALQMTADATRIGTATPPPSNM
ncbi:MAG: hypothetical protein ACE5G8_13575, partial [Anaerolineae bacterium]